MGRMREITMSIQGTDVPAKRKNRYEDHVRYVELRIAGSGPIVIHWARAVDIGNRLINAAELTRENGGCRFRFSRLVDDPRGRKGKR